MAQLLLVTTNNNSFTDLSEEIEQQGGAISWAITGRQALDTIGNTTIDLVITDETLGDMTGLELIERLVAVNPLINAAAVSSLSKDAYHQASEGLGILMQLPPKPGRVDGERLMAQLNQILNLTITTNKKA